MKKRIKELLNTIRYGVRFFGKGIEVHPSCYISRKAVIRNTDGGIISIGKNCEIHPYAMILSYGGKIIMGDNCSVNPYSIIYGHGGVEISSGVRIACHSVIIPANHVRPEEGESLHKSDITCNGIKIGKNVWIAAGCQILDGVEIGSNSVIAAGSVVNKPVPTNTTVGGVPSKVIKKHNSKI